MRRKRCILRNYFKPILKPKVLHNHFLFNLSLNFVDIKLKVVMEVAYAEDEPTVIVVLYNITDNIVTLIFAFMEQNADPSKFYLHHQARKY